LHLKQHAVGNRKWLLNVKLTINYVKKLLRNCDFNYNIWEKLQLIVVGIEIIPLNTSLAL